ncbi:MAG: hypothetical protein K0S34_676 [Bacillales bacterium]|nr:hypothetical protein [Bacillales bacterium]
MADLNREIVGSWITSIGTIIAAIGSTPKMYKSFSRCNYDELSDDLKFLGNALQGIGNSVEASEEEPDSLEKGGNLIQTSGNVAVLFSLTTTNDVTAIKLDITGNLLQALGGLIAAFQAFVDNTPGERLDAIGNILQVIGNSTQAVGGLADLQDLEDDKRFLEFIGSWIQAVGAIICTFAAQLETSTIDLPVK